MADDRIEIDIIGNDQVTNVIRRVNGHLAQTKTTVHGVTDGVKTSHTAIKNYGTGLSKTSGSMTKLNQGLNSTMLRFIGLEAIISVGTRAFQGLQQWVGESVTKFREFEKAMAEVSTIMTGSSIKAFTEAEITITRLSTTYGKGVQDLSKGMYDILSAAFDASEGMRLLEIATRASMAGITDVSTSVDVFTSILNAWGLSVAQSKQISDDLFQTVVRGKLVFEDLAHSMGYIAPIAANLGVEFKEISAALSTVTRQGQHVDMATRGLALMLQNISNLAPAASEAATKYGVDLSHVALQVGGLEYILKDLNAAMQIHGAEILPEMIRNMRSLRVAMALAGDEGIVGFIDDLDRLRTGSGQTEEALTRMMAVTQQQADILEQQMAKLERRIGETWSAFDIWKKEVKLWWGAVFTGESGDAEVQKFKDAAADLQINAYKMIKGVESINQVKPMKNILQDVDFDQFDTAAEKILHLRDTIIKEFDTSQIGEYLDISKQLEEKVDLKQLQRVSQMQYQAIEAEYNKWFGQARGFERMIPKHAFKEFGDYIAKEYGVVFDNWEKLAGEEFSWGNVFNVATTLGMGKRPQIAAPMRRVQDTISQLGDAMEKTDDEIELLQMRQQAFADSSDDFQAALDNASDAIDRHQENIFTLQRALKELNDSVTNTYTTIGGMSFEGMDYWEITTQGMSVAVDRFNRFSQAVIKYGGSMKTDYMDNIKALVSEYENVDAAQLEVLGSLSWYNEEIFNSISGIEEFGGDMETVINTLSNYNATLKEAKKIQNQFSEEMQLSKIRMMELNLEMMNIQLMGMSRRRGLTRMEEKRITQIRIEQTKEQIKNAEWQLTQEQEMQELGIEHIATAADRAHAIYTEYTDKVGWALQDLKDIQDDELANMLASIDMKESKLISYTELHKQEHANLELSMLQYQGLLQTIASDPHLNEWYEEIYGINALDMAKGELESYLAMLEDAGLADNINLSDYDPKKVSETGTGATSSTSNLFNKFPEAIRDIITDRNPYAADFLRSRKLPSHARGSYYIPKDMPIMAHRGEQVVPSGERGTNNGNISVTINVQAQVDKDYDVERLAAKLGEAMQAKLIDKKGRSTFRWR